MPNKQKIYAIWDKTAKTFVKENAAGPYSSQLEEENNSNRGSLQDFIEENGMEEHWEVVEVEIGLRIIGTNYFKTL